LFDEVAGFVREIAPRPDVVKDDGFEVLRNWLTKRSVNLELLGVEVAEVVSSCDWFGEVRGVRDDIIHSAALTIVFPEAEEILFQVHLGTSRRRVLVPEVMSNDGVADFRRYAALAMAQLDDFLSRLTAVVLSSVAAFQGLGPANGRSSHRGLTTLKEWLERL